MISLPRTDYVVRMPAPFEYRLHIGQCTCGAQFGYDRRSFEAAQARADQHIADHLEERLGGRVGDRHI